MTLETKNLLIGMVAGFAFGLVVCSGVHAEPGPIPCDPPRTGMACYLTDTNDDGPSILWDAPRLQTPCERTMAEAMRAMEPFIPKFVDPVDRRRRADSPLAYDDLVCRAPFCQVPTLPDTRTLAEKLRDVQRDYERHQEALGYQIVQDEQERWAYRQWDAAKACWATDSR